MTTDDALKIILTLVLMVGTYFLIKDFTVGLSPAYAIIIIFIDETFLAIMGYLGWKMPSIFKS